jgi:hypothetical protein
MRVEPSFSASFTARQMHVLRTQYAPTPEEVQSMSQFLCHLQARKHAQRVALFRGLLAPVRGVPEDVLRDIFAYCTDDADAVAGVCYRWRMIAHGMRELWTTIHLHRPQRHMNYVGESLLLDVHLLSSPSPSMLPVLHRAQSLNLDCGTLDLMMMDPPSMRSLKSLTVDITPLSRLFHSPFSASRFPPSLVCLELNALLPRHTVPVSYYIPSLHVHLHYITHLSCVNSTVEDILDLVHGCTKLQSLRISDMFGHHLSILPSLISPLSSVLRTIHLNNVCLIQTSRLFEALSTPLLEEVEVDNMDALDTVPRRITSLRVMRWIRRVDAGVLTEFEHLRMLEILYTDGRAEEVSRILRNALDVDLLIVGRIRVKRMDRETEMDCT